MIQAFFRLAIYFEPAILTQRAIEEVDWSTLCTLNGRTSSISQLQQKPINSPAPSWNHADAVKQASGGADSRGDCGLATRGKPSDSGEMMTGKGHGSYPSQSTLNTASEASESSCAGLARAGGSTLRLNEGRRTDRVIGTALLGDLGVGDKLGCWARARGAEEAERFFFFNPLFHTNGHDSSRRHLRWILPFD